MAAIHEHRIRFAVLQFADINGVPKSLSVSTKIIESIFESDDEKC